jgi:hypothetical protein
LFNDINRSNLHCRTTSHDNDDDRQIGAIDFNPLSNYRIAASQERDIVLPSDFTSHFREFHVSLREQDGEHAIAARVVVLIAL